MEMTRRDFLDRLLFTSLAAAGISLVAPLPFYLSPPSFSMRRDPVLAGQAEDLSEGEGRNLVYAGAPAVVLRREGKLSAFSRVCPHRQCAVNWKPETARFHCPCHGAEFDATGRALKGPTRKPLQAIPVDVSAQGEIRVGT